MSVAGFFRENVLKRKAKTMVLSFRETRMAPTAYTESFYKEAMDLIGKLSKSLMARKIMLGTAESCTGGLAASLCTELPGSSAWFAGGVISYADNAKRTLLGIEEPLLTRYGAVSRQVVEAMALGVLVSLGVGAGLALSGIAGPGGGSPEKPVGTVWIAVAVQEHEEGNGSILAPRVESRRVFFSGQRQEVRAAAVLEALRMLEGSLHTVPTYAN